MTNLSCGMRAQVHGGDVSSSEGRAFPSFEKPRKQKEKNMKAKMIITLLAGLFVTAGMTMAQSPGTGACGQECDGTGYSNQGRGQGKGNGQGLRKGPRDGSGNGNGEQKRERRRDGSGDGCDN